MPGKEDLEGVDFSLAKSLEMLRNIHLETLLGPSAFNGGKATGPNSDSGSSGGGGVSKVSDVNTAENLAAASALFSSTFFETFTTTTSDDRTVELLPNGAHIDVTFETRQQYCDLVLNVSCYTLAHLEQ